MSSHANPPEPFLPVAGEKARLDFADWRSEFELYLTTREEELQRQINLRRLGQQLNEGQQAALNALQTTEHSKVRDLFNCLGSEGFRRFRMKSGWNTAVLIQANTLAAALAICDDIFRDKPHPVLARTKLYKRTRKSKETFEEFLCDLRRIAKDCQLGNQEDLRIMEAILIGCNDKELLEKILDAYPAIPTLQNVLDIALRHEATKKDSKLVKSEPSSSGAFAIYVGSDSETEHPPEDSSDDSAETVFVLKKGKGNNRNYLLQKQQKNSGQRANSSKKSSQNSDSDKQSNTPRCTGCGKEGHFVRNKQCAAKGKKCSFCKGFDHFDKMCRIKKRMQEAELSTLISVGEGTENSVNSVSNEEAKILCDIDIRPAHLAKSNCDFPPQKITFWADTGAMVSTITEALFRAKFPNQKMLPTQKFFKAYNGTHTAAIGRFHVKASYKGGDEKPMTLYVVPNGCLSLFGLHQMGQLGMKLDTSSREIFAAQSASPAGSHSEILLAELKETFPTVFSDEIGKMKNFEHRIRLKEHVIPVQMPVRPVPYSKVDRLKSEIEKCLKDDIIQPVPDSKSEWNSPVHGVNKPDGSLRITVDYSGTINPCIIPTIHQLPRPYDIFKRARRAQFLSKLDLKKAYWHIILAEESRPLTAFLTPSHGLLQFKRLPMGMTDSAACFQRAIEQSLSGIEGVAPFIDNILIFGDSREQHDDRVRAVFERLQRDGFRVTEPKILLGKQQISMLGQLLTVTEDGISIIPDPERNKDFLNLPPPKTLKKLQQFLGAANYFSSHIPHFATIAEPLFRLKRKRIQFIWDDSCTKAFEAIKDAIASPEVLVPYDPHCPAHLTTDASLVGLGAVLSIERDGKLCPVAFASKLMTETERRYSTPEHEALACVWAVEKFNQFLFGRHFTLHSDQQSLGRLMMSFGASATTGRRIQRWFDRLRHYDYSVKHIAGKDNVLADFLSRIGEGCEPSDEPTLPDDDDGVTIAFMTEGTLITPEEFLEASQTDQVLKRLCQYLISGWPARKSITNSVLRHFHSIRNELSEWNGIVFRGTRLVVPEIFQKQILERLHSGHPGIVRMKQLYRDLYYWCRGSTECEEFVESCQPCAASEKSVKSPEVPTGEFPPPSRPWERVAIDITGPFWTAPKRQEYVVVLMDYFSKWPEILITGNTTTQKITTWLEELFCAWGNPLELVSDNGPQFTSHQFAEFLAARSIKHNLTPVYCPQRNGLIERFNRVIKAGSQVISAQGGSFQKGLWKLLANFRATAPENGKSPALLARGWEIRTDADIRNPYLFAEGVETLIRKNEILELGKRAEIVREKAQRRKYTQTAAPPKPTPYRVGEVVQHKLPKSDVRKGQSPLSRPMKIVSQVGRWTFRLSDGQIWNARALNHYRPARMQIRKQPIEELDDIPDIIHLPPGINLRRTTRITAGIPPVRYSPD